LPLNTAVPTRAAHQKFEPTRKAEVAAFAKSWRYESRQRRVNCGTLIAFGVGAMGIPLNG